MRRRGVLAALAALVTAPFAWRRVRTWRGLGLALDQAARLDEVTDAMKEAYPADSFARSVEETYSPFYRALKRRP